MRFSKILLVDDDETSNFISKRQLLKHDLANKIDVSTNGQEAINYLDDCHEKKEPLPEVIFLDIKMPVMNGFDFLKLFETLKYQMGNYDPDIYILTSSENKNDLKKSRTFNIQGYIDKPLTKNKLLSLFKF